MESLAEDDNNSISNENSDEELTGLDLLGINFNNGNILRDVTMSAYQFEQGWRNAVADQYKLDLQIIKHEHHLETFMQRYEEIKERDLQQNNMEDINQEESEIIEVENDGDYQDKNELVDSNVENNRNDQEDD